VDNARTTFAMRAAGLGVWELVLETRAVYWSETLEEVAGLARGQGPTTAEAFMSYVDPDDRATLTERLEEAVRSPHEDFSAEFRLVRPDGERRWVESHARFLMGADGGPQALIGVGIDVTDRRTTELNLQQARKMEAIGRLAGGIAHDFNNLLTAILGYSELLLERVQHDPSMAADLEEIRKAGERAGRLTRQLLAFSRRQVLLPQTLDLNHVVLDLDRMLSRIIGEDVRLELLTGACLDKTKADPGQVEQILMNLVINARDAMPQGGALRVRTDNATIDAEFTKRHKGSTPGRYVLLEVQDTGSGMGPDVLAHVFEPFFTTKGPGKGTGLGLATVYGIVKQSGGYVTIDSALGAGTTVRIYLPAVAEADEPLGTIGTPTPAVRTLSGTETVLVCEDDLGIRQLVVKTLAQHGYTVLEASDVHDAVALAEGHNGPMHLLLTDIVMPDLNGPNLAQHVVRRRPEIKVLYISGFPHSVAVGARSLSSRATLLAKPFTPRVLATSVRECLDR
jgi:PAS domain S-box-containing protein